MTSQIAIKKACCMTWPSGLVGGLGDVQRGQCQATASYGAKCAHTHSTAQEITKSQMLWHIKDL